jgi:hypothetical protein
VQTGKPHTRTPPEPPPPPRRPDQLLDFEPRAEFTGPDWRSDPHDLPPRRTQPRRIRSTAGTGCVAIYAGIMGFSAVLAALGGLVLTGMAVSDSYRASPLMSGIAIVMAYAMAIVYGTVAFGLWNLQNWARIVVLVIHGFGVLSGLFSLSTVLLGLFTVVDSSRFNVTVTPAMLGVIVPLLANGVIFHWFWVNGNRFD